jgi:hypothetical protein
VPFIARLAGTPPPVAVGLPGAVEAPGRDEPPLTIGTAPVAVPDAVDPVSLGGVVATTATTTATTAAMTTPATTAAQTPRRADDRWPLATACRLGMDMSALSFGPGIRPAHQAGQL